MSVSPQALARLQALIDRSAATAGSAIRRNFASDAWRMTAEQFVAFWGESRMATLSTASLGGAVHAAPLDVFLVDGRFYVPTFPDSVRLQDHRTNPRCVITSWDGPYHAAIITGRASEVDRDPTGRTAAAGDEQGYTGGAMVTVVIEPTRIYAIRPPEGHPGARAAP